MDRQPEEPNLKSLSELIQVLQQNESRTELVTELETLQAILGEQAVHCQYQEHPTIHAIQLTVHLQVTTTIEPPIHETDFDLCICVPDYYPSSSEVPAVTLLARYIGPFSVDTQLVQSVKDSPSLLLDHDQLLYDLVSNAKDIVERFYLDQSDLHQLKLSNNNNDSRLVSEHSININHHLKLEESSNSEPPDQPLPEDKNPDFIVHSSLPILDRKSTFMGHSVALNHPDLVPCIIQQLLSDKKIAKATHNIIAWRCEINGCLHQDHDDDGESAAGSRMLHLLSILNVKNVFVCVSRWFGGIHLGADRFKHINQATRDALTVGGFIPSNPSGSSTSNKPQLQNQTKNSLRTKKKQ